MPLKMPSGLNVKIIYLCVIFNALKKSLFSLHDFVYSLYNVNCIQAVFSH